MPELTQYGILPPGIHEMNMDEVGRLFGNIPKSSHRLALFEKLTKYIKQLQTLPIGIAIIVDGSFVMTCVEMPKDIDVILVMPKEWSKTIEKISPECYNLLSSMAVEAEFTGIHLFVADEHSPLYHSWIRQFSNIKGDWHFMFDIPYNMSKGLIRITL